MCPHPCLLHYPTGCSTLMFESFAAMSNPTPTVKDAPYTEGWKPALLPYHSGAAPPLPIALRRGPSVIRVRSLT